MEKEFEDYWNKHQKRLILNAPKALRDEYIESTKLDSPIDWVCFILPVALGIGLQPILDIRSEILSWAVVLLIVVVCFAVMQLVKPMLQKKKSTIQVVKSIKAFYYEVYKKNGLKKLGGCVISLWRTPFYFLPFHRYEIFKKHFYLQQSPNFHKLGLCLSAKDLYLCRKLLKVWQRYK
ncbi:hypothetical protein [Segatella copri]|uniref:hypothetical protein n=1 Tax=Segatella copri TaxID=165179 RepID=UPI002230A414|nr:hypothetical protein [Segatella copri]MCW4121566.1 hypothetical protein [Segatella copri]